jgi:hypothetical protein
MLHNQILSNKKTKKKLPLILISFGLFALFCIVSVFGVYSISFKDFSFVADTEKFGQFGDFVGGTLNPILAFLSFMALLYTIKIQMDELKLSREELEATRKELEASRIAQQEQSESLKLQNEATKLQIFENTLFKLFDVFNLAKNTVNIDISNYSTSNESKISNGTINNNYDEKINYAINENKLFKHGTFTRNEAFEIYSYIVKKNYINNYDNFNDKYEKNTGVYLVKSIKY